MTEAARATIGARIATRRATVASLLDADPSITTARIAAILGWDISTIRRDRAALDRRSR